MKILCPYGEIGVVHIMDQGTPIDLLDEGCMIHDGCYEHGKKNCSCNNKLINHINRYYRQMGGREKAMAWAIKLYFISENKSNGC